MDYKLREVVTIGLFLFYRRLHPPPRGEGHAHETHAHDHAHGHHHSHAHEHDGHTHSHLPPDVVGWRGLVALGVSGGLVPCPAALILLLGAISLDRLGLGVVLVVAFSAGLAVVLTGIGALMVYARRLFERFSFEARVPRLVPIMSALLISLAGLMIVLGSLGRVGIG